MNNFNKKEISIIENLTDNILSNIKTKFDNEYQLKYKSTINYNKNKTTIVNVFNRILIREETCELPLYFTIDIVKNKNQYCIKYIMSGDSYEEVSENFIKQNKTDYIKLKDRYFLKFKDHIIVDMGIYLSSLTKICDNAIFDSMLTALFDFSKEYKNPDAKSALIEYLEI